MPHYIIAAYDPTKQLLKIKVTVKKEEGIVKHCFIPSWVPGSYTERHFARHIVQIQANAPLHRDSVSTWSIGAYNDDLIMEYTYWAFDDSVRGAYLDTEQWYFDGGSVFIGFTDLIQKLHTLRVDLQNFRHATVATSMPKGTKENTYIANSYTQLIDNPFLIAASSVFTFQAQKIPHTIAIYNAQKGNLARIATDVQKICDKQIAFFGKHPSDFYTFILRVTQNRYGGLEHLASTSLMCAQTEIPIGNAEEDAYTNLLGLFSHEYFHSWWVKSVRPAEFHSMEHNAPILTEQLWAYEGITSYFDEKFLVHAGLLSAQKYIKLLAKLITRVTRINGATIQTLKDSSVEAWIKFYHPNSNSPNTNISYYAKGALVAWCIDILIRHHSDRKYALSTLVKDLWERYQQTGAGTHPQDFIELCKKYGGEPTAQFLQKAVYTTDPLPLENILGLIGLKLQFRARKSDSDEGADESTTSIKAYLGIKIAANLYGVKLATVHHNTPAQKAGLAPNDVIVALANQRVTEQNIQDVLDRFGCNTPIPVTYFRDDVLHQTSVELVEPPKDTAYITVLPDAADTAKLCYEDWLNKE